MPHHHKRKGPRIVPLGKIAERVGVPVKRVTVHLPEPDEPEPVENTDIRTRRRVWEDIRPSKLRASYTPGGGVAR